MGLIKRKQSSEDVALRCPNCHECVPAGARQCTMCGHSLADAARDRASDAQGR